MVTTGDRIVDSEYLVVVTAVAGDSTHTFPSAMYKNSAVYQHGIVYISECFTKLLTVHFFSICV